MQCDWVIGAYFLHSGFWELVSSLFEHESGVVDLIFTHVALVGLTDDITSSGKFCVICL